MSVDQLLDSAVRLHRGGQLDDARQIYLQVIAANPYQADALNLLGLVSWQTGRYAEAAEHLQRAIALDASQAAFFANLGEAYRGLGRLDEAIDNYRQAVRMQPTAAIAHVNLGTLEAQAGQLSAAIASWQRGLQLDPNQPTARFHLACAFEEQGRLAAASVELEKVLAANADHLEALTRLGSLRKRLGNLAGAEVCYECAIKGHPNDASLHFELGNVRQLAGRTRPAAECYRRAIELDPDYAQAHCNLGNTLRERGEPARAIEHLERAIALSPQMSGALSNLGAALQDQGRLAEAQIQFERALALEPRRPEFLYNLATVLKDRGFAREALERYEAAIAERPDYAQAICSRGMAQLSLGEFERGWADYERRVDCPQFDTLKFPQPLWDGAPTDQRLLVHCEQGFGDTLQFVRYLPLVAARAANVTLAAQEPLIPLLTVSGYQNLVARDQSLPPFDVHAPLLSLSHILGTRLDTVPRDVPYLAADPRRIETWRAHFANLAGLKIGIAWQGRTSYRTDRQRSIPLAEFAPLAAVPGVQLISLQKGPGHEQIAALDGRFNVLDLDAQLDNTGKSFMDTAALIKCLNLVITCDTAIAHLAGGLGVPVWVALSHGPDFRWLLEREDCPWYPTMRLFRQQDAGNWGEVFARIANELRGLASAH